MYCRIKDYNLPMTLAVTGEGAPLLPPSDCNILLRGDALLSENVIHIY